MDFLLKWSLLCEGGVLQGDRGVGDGVRRCSNRRTRRKGGVTKGGGGGENKVERKRKTYKGRE